MKNRRFSPTDEAEVATDWFSLWKKQRRNPNAGNEPCRENGASSYIKIVTKSSWKQLLTPSCFSIKTVFYKAVRRIKSRCKLQTTFFFSLNSVHGFVGTRAKPAATDSTE